MLWKAFPGETAGRVTMTTTTETTYGVFCPQHGALERVFVSRAEARDYRALHSTRGSIRGCQGARVRTLEGPYDIYSVENNTDLREGGLSTFSRSTAERWWRGVRPRADAGNRYAASFSARCRVCHGWQDMTVDYMTCQCDQQGQGDAEPAPQRSFYHAPPGRGGGNR